MELDKKSLIHRDALTVTGKTIGENIACVKNRNPEILRPIENPYSSTGGIAILFGNLAPDGTVVKRSACAPELMKHTGPARVFDSEEACFSAVQAGKIHKGDVVVIRYEGPRGGPGMREMLKLGIPEHLRSSVDIEGAMRNEFAAYYTSHICDRTQEFNGVESLFEKLQQNASEEQQEELKNTMDSILDSFQK